MLIDDKLLLLGIRHHGPGSAASALQALTDFKPDCLLVEGAPEAEPLLAFMDDARLVPPVAQLIYAPDDARDSVFYPFTEFSPEWQAMRFARAHGIAIRLMDLPQAHHLALARQDREAALSQTAESESESGSLPEGEVPIDTLSLSQDPLDMLASAAGFEDGERWWEFMVEQHPQQQDVFVAIADAMSALREQVEKEAGLSDREARREAWMRRTLREAQKSGYERIAVICGAWHVPALLRKVPVKDDNTLLKGLPKIKLQATWIPWTHGRISYRSGYGAGVTSPGWYAHLWQHTQAGTRSRITSGWLTKAARYLRDQHYDVPPASVIEAVRFADTLATLRQRPLPSLDEMNEAIQTLFCFGESAPLVLLQKPLLIGEKLGNVPDNIPGVPLQEDLQSTQKRLRMKVSAVDTPLDLDLRNEIGLARSTLLHQLVLLGLPWGKCVSARGGKGTFKEQWVLQWQPEFELRLIELNLWGNTVSSACQHFVAQEIANTTELASVAHWIDRLLLADLPGTITQAIERLQVLSAVSGDIEQLMRALPRLINITRYGDVRGTHSAALLHVVEGFCARIMIGLVHYSRHIDEAEAAAHTSQMQALSDALKLLACDDYLNDWWQCLQTLAAQEDTQPLIRGCCYRLLLNAAIISSDEVERALRLALSSAQAPLQAAQWIEGLLAGSGLLLVHDDRLWSVLNHYVCSLDEARFLVLLPLLRRSFANFSTGERSQLLVKSRALTQIATTGSDQNFNYEGAIRALPLLYQMIGHSLPETGSETALTGTGEGGTMSQLTEQSRRWRLLLGSDAAQTQQGLQGDDVRLDQLLGALYDQDESQRQGSLANSAPKVSRWLGEIRDFFPASVVQVMQKDAIERLNLKRLLLEPEMLQAVEADVHLLATLISLSHLIPEKSKQAARDIVQKIVDELMQRLRNHTEQAIRGSLNRAQRKQRPRHQDIDWNRTLRANLMHYQPDYQTIIPQRLVGYGRRQPSALKEVVLCVDQSGSMASSVIYASIFAAVMASIPALRTQLVVFDTAVVDLTEKLQDPVDVLFGTQLGGGTDINSAMAYCQQRITKPQDTTLVLITDLYEGGNASQLVTRADEIKRSGVNLVTLLALNDDGAPSFDKRLAQIFANLDIPTFACTPDQFPDLMAAALNGGDVADWAARNEIAITPATSQ